MTAALAAVTIAACGVGEGATSEGVAQLTVTRDYGAEQLLEAESTDPSESETVVRFLDREAEVETEYGGNFVSAIDGISGEVADRRSRDWFFYVNGYWSPIGAGESDVRPGDRIWWDYRDWTDAYMVSAVVGSFPEPFLHGYKDEQPPTEVVCLRAETACETVEAALAAAGVEATSTDQLTSSGAGESLRILVGEWGEVREDPAALLMEKGPSASGVYARIGRCSGGWYLSALDDHATVRQEQEQAGWIAALRKGDDQPTWVVSGTDTGEVEAAAGQLDEESLRNHYALAVTADGEQTLPVAPDADAVDSSTCGES